ncbi:MAG: flagellin FliC [Deltaproteobacteria bacterium]|nr:flagellin FliC [Deltaproteobacteria bacterium]
MALEIKSNISSMQASRQVTKSHEELKHSIERLSSGLRINRSADDAAGLAVSERIRARIRGLDVAKRNASDAVSYIQTAEGGLNEVANIVIRMRELTTQAATDTLGQRERSFLDREFQQLRQEAKRIMVSTEFNGKKVLTSDVAERPIDIFVGASQRGEDIEGNLPDFGDEDPDVIRIDLSDLEELSEKMASVVEEDISILPSSAEDGAQDLGPSGTQDLMARLDSALDTVASYRSTLGSVQARLDSAVASIDVSTENLAATRSRIVDVDYAQETANFARARILTQAGVSVQSHANAIPELVLSLLR